MTCMHKAAGQLPQDEDIFTDRQGTPGLLRTTQRVHHVGGLTHHILDEQHDISCCKGIYAGQREVQGEQVECRHVFAGPAFECPGPQYSRDRMFNTCKASLMRWRSAEVLRLIGGDLARRAQQTDDSPTPLHSPVQHSPPQWAVAP